MAGAEGGRHLDPTVGLCLGSLGVPRGVGVFLRGTPVWWLGRRVGGTLARDFSRLRISASYDDPPSPLLVGGWMYISGLSECIYFVRLISLHH